jgi:hypothetical protein
MPEVQRSYFSFIEETLIFCIQEAILRLDTALADDNDKQRGTTP